MTGDNGILKRAAEAKEENEKAQTDEQGNLKKYDEIISDYTGVDWNIAKANATKHPDQKNSDVIAIGTNGKSVNMDLWEYNLDEETGGYGLTDEMSLKTTASSDASKGYLGDNFENIIIPQFIKINREAEWVSVTNLDWTFLIVQI